MRRNFIATGTVDKKAIFFNIDQIRLIDEIRPGHCKIWFSKDHTAEINGPAAAEFVARMGERSITLNGEEITLSNQNLATPKSE